MSKPVRVLYEDLCKQLKEITHLRGIAGLLDWDQQVMMPSKAAESRAHQSNALAGVIHDKKVSPALGKLLQELYADEAAIKSELNEYELANVRDAKRKYDREVLVPKELAQKSAKLQAEAYEVWAQARKEDKWELFAPKLEEWVQLRKEICAKIDPSKQAYDVCIDEFERGMTQEELSQVFDALKEKLIPLISKVVAAKKPISDDFLRKSQFDVKKQIELNESLVKVIGFDTSAGRLDVSVHPFTGGAHPTDVRMTTRYKDTDISEGITGTIHETGHALYEQGRNKDYADLPVSEALSMGVHESQSLLWERMVGLSRPFFQFYWPKLQEAFPSSTLTNHTFEDAYKAFNLVQPGLIRVDSDELTYPLHIIIRFEIERDIFAGKLDVKDLPKVWNEKIEHYLGVKVPTNKEGVLQDIHWSVGAFGYFPTYTLGAIYACQIFHHVKTQIPTLDEEIRQGNFSSLKAWLNKNIHQIGSLHASGEDLLKVVMGRGIDIELFIEYLTKKYKDVYQIDL
eukprot:TRINITY_DN8069_c0_g1_i1.p1 TRINITY_DN8069_c0_g1~~TRINITY_DN8069_c0_g1_i1.p1  ORF type:complete len:543 (+),score=141.51 TRINITY_DN8069_c0_g1_i1:91-1629(+)